LSKPFQAILFRLALIGLLALQALSQSDCSHSTKATAKLCCL